jgi:2-polyprenyl-3-methyl-5-hydroxy-6-metoxy-1,4-benzoquinol methylase
MRDAGSGGGDSVAAFYNGLADEYHLLFADWDASVRRQGEILDRLIAASFPHPPTPEAVPHPPAPSPASGRGGDDSTSVAGRSPRRVLDCSCGIGTQAIGLALKGYAVHGTDLSPAAVARAQREAARLGVTLTTDVADLRALDAIREGGFDVVLSCDNAIPHLLSDDDLRRAAEGMAAKLRPGGLLVVSIRDYDDLISRKPRADLPRVFDRPEGRQIAFQVWDWSDTTPTYTVHQFITREAAGGWETHHESTVYRALRRTELSEIVRAAGLHDIRWHLPAKSGYYQPILTARRGADGR